LVRVRLPTILKTAPLFICRIDTSLGLTQLPLKQVQNSFSDSIDSGPCRELLISLALRILVVTTVSSETSTEFLIQQHRFRTLERTTHLSSDENTSGHSFTSVPFPPTGRQAVIRVLRRSHLFSFLSFECLSSWPMYFSLFTYQWYSFFISFVLQLLLILTCRSEDCYPPLPPTRLITPTDQS
jgi:hypothetical protein